MKIGWIGIVALLSLSGCKEEKVEAEPIRPAQVWETQAQVGEITERYSGEVQARQSVDFAFRVGGKLVSRLVNVGDTVKKGQELARLDDQDSKLTVNQSESGLQATLGSLASAQSNFSGAQGRLASAKANLTAAQSGLEAAQTAVDTAKASASAAQAAVGVAQAELDNAQLEYKRSEQLVQKGFASKAVMDRDTQRLQTAQANLKSVKANAAAAQSQVPSALARVKTSQAQVSAAEGEVAAAAGSLEALSGQIKSAQAQVNSTQDQLKLVKNQSGYTVLTSTVDGVVTKAPIEAGQVVGAGQAILSVARAGEYEVYIRVGEQAIKDLTVDRPATISLWADQQVTLQGTVREIAPAADANRTWLVKVAAQDPNQVLRLGMTATVLFSQPLPEKIAWLPATALFQQDKKPAIWIVGSDNKVNLQPVVVQRYLQDGLWVAGLNAGIKVVAAGVNRLHAGQQVNPVPYNGQAKPTGL
ncbi:efflux RND transporter periplasmic adaptor subunit [Thiolinea disciformis]|uniref:efflux RND transporter periplasmic adaptor subunit n=1 Tax=Thiolinea disciformis TaxID=125614 RepID=UPI000372925B|nr:efflux RND transporter periplasmic adaptor subunit [Thiolinea disciformis]